MRDDAPPWNDLYVSGWAGTKQSLHLCAQMLGKIRVALSPPQPNWMHTALYVVPRGLTTGFIPYSDASIEGRLDVFDSTIAIYKSDGQSRKIPLAPKRSVADVYADLLRALGELDVSCCVSPVPQEIPDTTPLNEDRRAHDYDRAAALRWLETNTAVAGVFERWRSFFFGRSGIQLWWGAFDLSMMLFNGKHVAPPTDRGYLLKYDLDAELMNVGFYLGDEKNGPIFYGYVYPEPKGAETVTPQPKGAIWSAQLHEWVLPYDVVRRSPNPATALTSFIDWIYRQCVEVSGWDRNALTYTPPKPPQH